MKNSIKNYSKNIVICLLLAISNVVHAQIPSKTYFFEEKVDQNNITHELQVDGDYLIHTVYKKSPAQFIMTRGGFTQVEGNRLIVLLEFNSNYEKDQLRTLSIPFELNGKDLILEMKSKHLFKPAPSMKQDLDGKWLFATRGPDTGQERRGEENPRKTLKLLKDGRFQWIAYNTETMKFHGTGGGSFTSQDGKYIEHIEFFSKDNSRVGAELTFNYELKGNDWHHTGNNSKGEPMYEIWAKRKD
ncbi:hypothetical protein D9O36_06165 [Zobellia amurskyensis]|uniref:Membrane or secreted protein n=1 Tax=Zobellia amurskyensis TaxID=248905 RepID=A0A7X3D1D4_9FLAO|nr:hypothetical protein [Zobellia amurskyensis]MUH35418.1 hypothetical protein [Zobellia amurskyensis]